MRTIIYGDLEIEVDYVRPCNRKIFFDWYKDFWTISGLQHFKDRIYLVGNVFETGNDIDVRILIPDWRGENLNILMSIMKEAIFRGFTKYHVFVDIYACHNLLTSDYLKDPGSFEDDIITIGDTFILDGNVIREWPMDQIHDGLYHKQQKGVDAKYIEQMRIGKFFEPIPIEQVEFYIKNNFSMMSE